MVGFLKNNFFLLPALVLAVLLYGGIFSERFSLSYSSLVPIPSVAAVEGRIVSSPVLIQGRAKSCKAKMRLSRVWSKSGLAAAAYGDVDVYLPVALYEIYQPGKLYTKWRGKKGDFTLDQGALALLEGRFLSRPSAQNPSFECKSLVSCHYRPGLFGAFQKIRALSRLHFSRLMFAWGEAGGLLLALLSGSRAYLQKDAADAFKGAGLSHVLALSGMHLSLLGGLAFGIGRRIFGKKAARLLQFFSVVAFVWFAGKSPSLFRALLCSLAGLFTSAIKLREKSQPNVLAFVFILHVSIFPADAFELSFMLSYGALFGIFIFNEFCSKRLSSRVPGWAGGSLGASSAAQVFTMPLSLKFFGFFAPAGILSSAAVSPLVTVFVYAGLFCVFLSLAFPFLAPFCGGLLGLFYSAITRAVFFFAALPCVKL